MFSLSDTCPGPVLNTKARKMISILLEDYSGYATLIQTLLLTSISNFLQQQATYYLFLVINALA